MVLFFLVCSSSSASATVFDRDRLSASQDFNTLENIEITDSFMDNLYFNFEYNYIQVNNFYEKNTEVYKANGIWVVRGFMNQGFPDGGIIALEINQGEEWNLPHSFSCDSEVSSLISDCEGKLVQVAFVEDSSGGYKIINIQQIDGDQGGYPNAEFLFEKQN